MEVSASTPDGNWLRILTAVLLIGLAAILGCQPDPEPAPAAETIDPEEQVVEAPVEPAAPPTRGAVEERAERLAGRLMDAINDGDAAVLAELSAIPPEIPDPAQGAAALEDYRAYFGGSAVQGVEQVHREASGDTWEGEDLRLIFELVATNGTRKPVLVYYEARFDTLRAFDEFLRYSNRAHAYASAVVEAIRVSDPEELALLLTIDDVTYPVSLAREAISHYAERFDLGTLTVTFTGLEPRDRFSFDRAFLFSIRGSRDGRTQSNSVRLVPGDGLLSWKDPLIPTAPAV